MDSTKRWAGGKAGAGVYQKLINLIPPHRTYIETHLGGGAIMRYKLPAKTNMVYISWIAVSACAVLMGMG